MNLTDKEKKWLPVFGSAGKITMGISCWLNQSHYPLVETIFENVAQSRKRLLMDWIQTQWEILEGISFELGEAYPDFDHHWLREKSYQLNDFSELFLVSPSGEVLESTSSDRKGSDFVSEKALTRGLSGPFLYGPYVDEVTERLGFTSSEFIDAVTLMFIQPIMVNQEVIGCLCARLPNDVIGDLIQRESGHVYKESGDNYLFMANSVFDKSVKSGTALSRSRFEDESVVAGDNLKSGIKTPFNTVRVKQHTEFELIFNAPSTGKLHPGVRETINNGENLFVTYPGYTDYRGIPVIGKGVTFNPPHSDDTWGMMCEADLEEVYHRRSLGWQYLKRFLATLIVPVALLAYFLDPSVFSPAIIGTGIAWLIGYSIMVRPLSNRVEIMLAHLVSIAEGGRIGDTLGKSVESRDSLSELALWMNNFSGKVQETIEGLSRSSQRIAQSSGQLSDNTESLVLGSEDQRQRADSMSSAVEELSTGINNISEKSGETENSVNTTSETANTGRKKMQSCSSEIQVMSNQIEQTKENIKGLHERSNNIGSIIETIRSIAEQTNLLALNAAIEAARAGEQGRGFAVVADEVRSLAGRTSDSTNEIESMISGMQSDVEKCVSEIESCSLGATKVVSFSDEADQSLVEINNSVGQVMEMINDIRMNTEQQGQASNEVAENITVLAEQADKNHLALSKNRAAVHGLKRLSNDLDRISSRFVD